SQEHIFDWKEFADFSNKEVQRGSYPIFMLPLFRSIDLDKMAVGTGFHVFVVCDDSSGQLIALTMDREPSRLRVVDHPARLYQLVLELESNCKLHVLTHG